MRTVLVTGPGGSGRTTAAAATALTAARRGARTLVLSADPTDTLGAALATPTSAAPTSVEPGLTAIRLAPADRFREDLAGLQEKAASALDLLGATRLDAEELTPLPGSHELALLRALRDSAHGPYDLVVVDLPSTPQALALLALPEQLRRYLRRLLPPERQAARALRPLLGRLAGVPMPAEWLYETADRWDTELAAAQAVIEDPHTTVRLVAEPTPAAADALLTTTTALALQGLRADALLASRVLPDGSTDPWLTDAAARQRKVVATWQGTYDVHELPHLGRDPRGADDLAALGAPPVPAAPAATEWPVEDRIADEGVLVWHLPLPGTVREDLGLVRRGDELVVTAGPLRRIVSLPSALRRCTVAGAGLRDGVLRIRFTPDPDLWPRGR
ncbi:ArsA family ATPase [Streptomyces sp. NPDC056121]|uniref:ArsA family ATPase n=1 Tax=Streptomyces TaxID=1883 RepID=UPI001D0B5544|nr:MULTISPECIES: ArsA-related P-loop ATPase [Streptomyces]MCX5081217.1 ArsA family ATPase [Streptomyces sp. NBC_00401]UDL99413.1 ArsA family ATPase [Streptomyces longhuiensis]